PVLARETGAELPHCGADLVELLREREVHQAESAARTASGSGSGRSSASTWTTVWRPSTYGVPSFEICHAYRIEVVPTWSTLSRISISSANRSTFPYSASAWRRG